MRSPRLLLAFVQSLLDPRWRRHVPEKLAGGIARIPDLVFPAGGIVGAVALLERVEVVQLRSKTFWTRGVATATP